ncbi:Hypothetical predicted protein [Octopus vulgaris]|uniref:Uncharacterized protein n=1 Tax=Octopus vulgaris TaxID=6645 RepID=A0AA36BGL8_OCTVU|nr:Hypothetical predicted protein [Octopus vulgaris]
MAASLQDCGADHVAWRHTINDAVSSFEISRSDSLEDKHQRRKNNAAASSDPDKPYPYHHRNRISRCHIGLISRERA